MRENFKQQTHDRRQNMYIRDRLRCGSAFGIRRTFRPSEIHLEDCSTRGGPSNENDLSPYLVEFTLGEKLCLLV